MKIIDTHFKIEYLGKLKGPCIDTSFLNANTLAYLEKKIQC